MSSKWSLYKESGRWVIRRWEGKKYARLPVGHYRHIKTDEAELRAFVLRLNAPYRTKEAVAVKHAFISPALQDEYRDLLLAQIPTERDAHTQYNYLREHFLKYFIEKLNLSDPKAWYLVHKTQWANYLLGLGKSVSTLRKIIQEANRFIEWLAEKRPGELPAMRFKPISRAKLKQLAATARLKERPHFIKDSEWAQLKVKLPAAQLCYLFGLRRSEALALKLDDVRKDYLRIERQQSAINQGAALKGRKNRKVPYWFSSPKEAHALISALIPKSADTLGDEWAFVTKKYKLHDLRHTFITRALRNHSARDVQLAVGHENLATTMKYAHDDRDFGDEIWVPKAG